MNDTLCWSCKRATCETGHYCPWAAKGKHVDGWEAEKGVVLKSPLGNGKVKIEQAYRVISCPLYQKDQPFDKMSQFYQDLRDKTGCPPNAHGMNLRKKLKLYQELGNVIPKWVMLELELREKAYYKKLQKGEENEKGSV